MPMRRQLDARVFLPWAERSTPAVPLRSCLWRIEINWYLAFLCTIYFNSSLSTYFQSNAEEDKGSVVFCRKGFIFCLITCLLVKYIYIYICYSQKSYSGTLINDCFFLCTKVKIILWLSPDNSGVKVTIWIHGIYHKTGSYNFHGDFIWT